MHELRSNIYHGHHSRTKRHSGKMASTVNIKYISVIFIGATFAISFGKREMVKDLNKCEQCFGFGGGTRLEVKVLKVLKPKALCCSCLQEKRLMCFG